MASVRCASKHIAGAVAGVENAVAEEHEHVAGFGLESELVVLGVVEQAERQAGGFDDFNLAVMTVKRARQPGIGHPHGTVAIVPHGVNQRHELALDAPLSQRKIDRAQHLRRPRLDGSVRAQNAADQRGINRCRGAFAADVADHHSRWSRE